MTKLNRKPEIGVIGLKGFPSFGGSARSGENLIEKLKDQYNFTIFNVQSHTNRKTGNYNGYKQIVFKESVFKPLNTFLYYFKSMLYCLFKGKFDILHIYHFDAAFIIPILNLKFKIVAGIRAQPNKLKKWNKLTRLYFHLMEFIFLKFPADIITSVSMPSIIEYKERTKKQIVYIPNGILFEQKEKIYPKISYNDYLVFSAGRVIESKGCHLFLEATKKISYKGKILVIGNLDHKPRYAKKLYELAKGQDVEFLGLIKNKDLLFAYIQKAKIAIFPSTNEGMSNMLMEITYMKTPVICSNIPENTYVFTKDETLFFENGNSEDLSDKLLWALANPEIMIKKSLNAYIKLETKFNWDILKTEYDKLFKQLIYYGDYIPL